jgi:hypothetical protein
MTTHGKGSLGKKGPNDRTRQRKPRKGGTIRAKSLGVPIDENTSEDLHLLSFIFGVSNCEVARIAIRQMADRHKETLAVIKRARKEAENGLRNSKTEVPCEVGDSPDEQAKREVLEEPHDSTR